VLPPGAAKRDACDRIDQSWRWPHGIAPPHAGDWFDQLHSAIAMATAQDDALLFIGPGS
jgi:hypothetical protein